MDDRDIEAVCAEFTDGHFESLFAWDECEQPDPSAYLDGMGLVANDARAVLAYVRRLAEKHARQLGPGTHCQNGLIADGLTRPLPGRVVIDRATVPTEVVPQWEWTPLGRACLRVGEREDNDRG